MTEKPRLDEVPKVDAIVEPYVAVPPRRNDDFFDQHVVERTAYDSVLNDLLDSKPNAANDNKQINTGNNHGIYDGYVSDEEGSLAHIDNRDDEVRITLPEKKVYLSSSQCS